MFDSQIAGQSVTVIKSPYYYDKYAVHLDKIVFVIEEGSIGAAGATAALQAGDLQVVDTITPDVIPVLQANKNLAVIQSPTLGYRVITINLANANGVGNPPGKVNTPLAQSPKLRLAFEEAINRAQLAKVVGLVDQPSCAPIVPNSPYFDPTIKCTPYDPADAKKLVAASGIPNPTVHILVTANSPVSDLVAQFVQSEEQAVGFNAVIDTADNATLLGRLAAGNYDTTVSSVAPTTPDPGLILFSALSTGASQNYAGFSSPQLDLVIANYFKSTGAQSQKTLVHAAEQIIQNARPILILYDTVTFLAYNSSELTGIQAVGGNLYRLAFAQYKV
jgi:peptide/nickel transport system substrate-binding protein